MRAFAVTAEKGSVSAAARSLGMQQPTLSRQIAALEDELGISLFERIGKRLVLTSGGLELLEHARAMMQAAGDFSLSATGQSVEMEGNVCISASELVAAFILPPILAQFHIRHPQVKIELVASNAPSDLRRREADIAIRTFRPTQPDLIAVKVCDLPSRFYASPTYLADATEMRVLEDLARADFIDFDDTGKYLEFLTGLGVPISAENFPFAAENHIVQMELARAGLGIVVLPDAIGDVEPSLARVLPDLDPMESQIWLVTHRELNTNRRIRAAFDFLKSELSSL